jgi:2-isopropylmalate synthase
VADKLIIFDTTLRDGEQSPGASMTKDEKLRIARQLERLKVDVIEAGFAASSIGDFDAVRAIALAIKESTVCSLARANDRDISRAAEALAGGASTRIHLFLATSALHMEKKLRMTPEQVHEQARLSTRFARNLASDIEFSPEDGYRSDPDFLCRVLEDVIAEGATTINIPDTVGYAIPELYGQFILDLRRRIPNSDKAIWSVHCHNDLGMAVANSLAGVQIGGARQVECTINGLGERAGNCSLEEVVMAVKTRKDYFGLEVGIEATQILPASRLVSQTTGFVVQPNKAVVGANAFAHASGIHQDGVLKARDTYEIMRAEDVGWSTNKIVLGKLSGANAFKQRLQDLGIEMELGGRRESRVRPLQGARRPQERHLRRGHPALSMDESAGANTITTACSAWRSTRRWASGRTPASPSLPGSTSTTWQSDGNGPVDARSRPSSPSCTRCRDAALFGKRDHLREHRVAGRSDDRLQHGRARGQRRRLRSGHRRASAKAYLAALNKLHSKAERVAAQG